MKEIIFPKDLYSDIRIEEMYRIWYEIQNGSVQSDGDTDTIGAMIRVYDGKLWYTASTNDIEHLQEELDKLAALATPNSQIYEDPVIARLETNVDEVICFDGDKCAKNIDRTRWIGLVNQVIEKTVDASIPEINFWSCETNANYIKKTFLSSKGAKIVQDMQDLRLVMYYGFTVNGVTSYAGKAYNEMFFEKLFGRENEIIKERDIHLDYAKKAVDIEPGEYTCILSPIATAMFTHECFGHKSESDFMLNDVVLREEWVMGKQVGGESICICDDGNLMNHGYLPYDDEGTKARETWLVKNGKLTGRLHDANSAVALSEELTGNCRAQDYINTPLVRMTNTYMAGGTAKPEDMIAGVKDGIYVYDVNAGTGQSTFTITPDICYRIRDGKVCEPVRVNVIAGSVFKALFDIDMLGDDFEMFDGFYCGKNGQSMIVSAGGPSVRIKNLSVN